MQKLIIFPFPTDLHWVTLKKRIILMSIIKLFSYNISWFEYWRVTSYPLSRLQNIIAFCLGLLAIKKAFSWKHLPTDSPLAPNCVFVRLAGPGRLVPIACSELLHPAEISEYVYHNSYLFWLIFSNTIDKITG